MNINNSGNPTRYTAEDFRKCTADLRHEQAKANGDDAKVCAIWAAFTVVVAVALLATIGTSGIGLLGAGICVAAGALALKYMESCLRSGRGDRGLEQLNVINDCRDESDDEMLSDPKNISNCQSE